MPSCAEEGRTTNTYLSKEKNSHTIYTIHSATRSVISISGTLVQAKSSILCTSKKGCKFNQKVHTSQYYAQFFCKPLLLDARQIPFLQLDFIWIFLKQHITSQHCSCFSAVYVTLLLISFFVVFVGVSKSSLQIPTPLQCCFPSLPSWWNFFFLV